MRLLSDEVLRKETGGFSWICCWCGKAGGSKTTFLRHAQANVFCQGLMISW